jgi:hypothetical protein
MVVFAPEGIFFTRIERLLEGPLKINGGKSGALGIKHKSYNTGK